MTVRYDFLTPLSRVYDANQASVVAVNSIRKLDGGVIIATEVAGSGLSMLSKIMTAISRHKLEEKKLRTQLRGAGHEIEQDILGKIYYGLSMLMRVKEFFEFLDESLKSDTTDDFIFEFPDRIREILEFDDTFERIKSLDVWEEQKAFLFKHGKDQIVRRVSAFYGMIGPKLSQIEREKMNVVNHFSGFIEALAKGVENNASKPPDLAIFRVRRTIQSLNNLAMLYVEVTSLSIECLNS